MRFARFISARDRISYGIIQGEVVEEISTTPFLPYENTGITHDLGDIRLLAPCLPSKVIGIGLNYKDHAEETGQPLPEVPMFFYKPSTTVIGPGDQIVRPAGCKRLDYEGELGVVIGSVAKNVPAARASNVVLGFTCAIDATARDFQAIDNQWGRAKGFDTAGPLGPWIETHIDSADLALETRVNGEVKQSSRTSNLVFNIGRLVEFISSFVTLLPGDVIMTGTPSGIGPLTEGDEIEVEIEDIGVLKVSVKPAGAAPS